MGGLEYIVFIFKCYSISCVSFPVFEVENDIGKLVALYY